MSKRYLLRISVAAGWIALSILAAQTPEFEVASVKAAAEPPFGGRFPIPGPAAEMIGFSGGPGSKDPGRFTCTGVSLKMLLVRAYKVRPYQIAGPHWMDTTWVDLTAKIPPNTTDEQFRRMLQKLLTERFRIELHRESKELPQYRLTVAKGGPKLQPADPEKKDGPPQMADVERQMAARMASMARNREQMGPHSSMHMGSSTLAKFAESLSGHLGVPVSDMTGLEGLYSFTLNWVPDNAPPREDGPSGPGMAVALQEQLGLKLEATKGAVEIIVIDKVEKAPIEN